MRVLMTTDPIGGVWTYALDLCREFVQNGHQVILASMGRGIGSEHRSAVQSVGGRLVASELRLEWMNDPWDDVDQCGEWLLRLEEEWAPDVVHLNGYAHAALPWRAPCIVVAHSCVVSWWWAVLGEDPPDRYDEYRRRVSQGIAAAQAVIAPTQYMLNELRRHYGTVPNPAVIPNGRSRDGFRPRAKWPYVASAGRVWDPAKNIIRLVDIAPGLPWPLFIAGDCESPVNGRADLGNARAPGLRFLGKLPERRLSELFGRASVYVHPARYEPFGLTVLEAARAGCALVLSDLPSLRELWQDAALFVDIDAPDGLADAIRHLARNPAAHAGLGARARQRAQGFTSQRMARAYTDLYRRVGATCAA